MLLPFWIFFKEESIGFQSYIYKGNSHKAKWQKVWLFQACEFYCIGM